MEKDEVLMFKGDLKFTGKHALIMQKYCKDKGTDNDYPFVVKNADGVDKVVYLFETRIYMYVVAAMIGIINKKSVEADKSTKDKSTIFGGQVFGYNTELLRICTFMHLTEKNKLSPDEKIKEAFSTVKGEKVKDEQYKIDCYARGGLEIIDDMFSSCKTYEDVCNKLFDLKKIINI